MRLALRGRSQRESVLNEDLALNVKYGLKSSEETSASASRATWIEILSTLLIVALCILVGIVLTQVTTPRIARGTGMLERIAAKDLTAHVEVTGTDELGRLGGAMNKCAETIRNVRRKYFSARH